jgi:hypothetical protein
VFADALVHHQRQESSFKRPGLHYRRLGRLSRRQRPGPVRERLPVGDPAWPGVQHLCARKMAPDPGRADQRRRSVRPLGAASSASTVSWAATPASTIPTWSATTTRWTRR